MLKILSIAILIGFGIISINQGYSQEVELSTFQESVQVIIDEKISKKYCVSDSTQY